MLLSYIHTDDTLDLFRKYAAEDAESVEGDTVVPMVATTLDTLQHKNCKHES